MIIETCECQSCIKSRWWLLLDWDINGDRPGWELTA